MKKMNFKVNDKVFAKMKGFSAWPARVIGGDEKKYKVKFYGSGDIAFMKGEHLFYYLRNKGLLRKAWRNKAYNDAFLQIESDIEQEGGTDGECTIADIPLDMWSATPEWNLTEEEENTGASFWKKLATDTWERLSPKTEQAYYDRPGPATVSQPSAKKKQALKKVKKIKKQEQTSNKAQQKEIFPRGFVSKLKPGAYKKAFGAKYQMTPKQKPTRKIIPKKQEFNQTQIPEPKQTEHPVTVKLSQSQRIMCEAFPTGFLSKVLQKEKQAITVAGPSLKSKTDSVQIQETTPKRPAMVPKQTPNVEKISTLINQFEKFKQVHSASAIFPEGFLSKLKQKNNQLSPVAQQQNELRSTVKSKPTGTSKLNHARIQKPLTPKVSVTPKQRYKQEAARARQKSSRQRVPATRSIIIPTLTKRQKIERARSSVKLQQPLARQTTAASAKLATANHEAKAVPDREKQEVIKKQQTPVQPTTTVSTAQQSNIGVQQMMPPSPQPLKTSSATATTEEQGTSTSVPTTSVQLPTITASDVSLIKPVVPKASPRKSFPVKVTPATAPPQKLLPAKALPTITPITAPPPLPAGHVGTGFTIMDIEHLKAIVAYADYVHLHRSHYEKKPPEERENNLNEIVIARLPSGELAAIKYNRQRVTRWRSELQRAEFEENEAKTALALKELIEQGVFTPEDGPEKFELELRLNQSTVKQMLHQQIIERKYARLQWLKNESLLAELDGKLKGSLAMDRADTAKGLEILNKMLEVDVHSLMLKKEPHIVDTIKRLRRYVGNIANWKMSANQLNQFNQDAEVIRDIADGIYAKYMNLFGVGDLKNTEFWDVFIKQSEILQAKCYGMTGLQFLALTEEPNSRRQLLDAANERVEKTIIAATEAIESFAQTISILSS